MRVSDFHFDLPEELIAQRPPEVRGSSRMLRVDRATGVCADDVFVNFPKALRAGDLLVLNDSRVLPTRLWGYRAGLTTQRGSPDPTGRIEVLLTRRIAPETWLALVRPSRKVRPGETLLFPDERGEVVLAAIVEAAGEYGERTLRFMADALFLEKLERVGHMPLPPYIHRVDGPEDRSRYQTVYAREAGSAAAPTAGLHFTPDIIEQLRRNGVELETITLHVGLGTFQPVRAEFVEDIRLHAEHYTLSERTAAAVVKALSEGRRVIAAGTTTTRTLEHCAAIDRLEAHSGETSIFIGPGHGFRVVSGMVTNFHLPESTLLMLVSGFLGSREVALAAYAYAVAERYRFYSYGDCMLIL